MSRVPLGLLAPVLLAAAACGSSPDVKRPDLDFEVPEKWRRAVASDGEVQDEWWLGFDDPRIRKVVEEVLARNYDLRAAAARILAAEAQARIAGADTYPQVAANFSAGRQRQNFIGLPFPGGGDDVLSTRSTTHTLTLDIGWELDVWGRVRSAQAAAMADLDARMDDLRAARLSLIAQTLRLWFGIAESQNQLELARETLASRETSADFARARYRAGVGSAAEVRLFQANEAGAEALVRQREQELEAQRRQLEVLMGRYPEAEIDIPAELPPIPATVPAGLPADLIARRPDVSAAERKLAASDLRFASAKAAMYPRISLTAQGGTRSEELVHLLDGRFWIWSLFANLMQPIFQGGRLVAAADLAEANLKEAEATFLKTALAAFADVERELAALEHLGRREAALAESASEAREAERIARERYASGLDGPNTLLDAQRSALLASGQLITAKRLRIDSLIHLHLALGGGFEPPAEEDEETESE